MSEQIWQVAYEAPKGNHILWWDLPPEVSNNLSTALDVVNRGADEVIIAFCWKWGDGSESSYLADVNKMLVQNVETSHCRTLRQLTVCVSAYLRIPLNRMP